MSLEDFFEFIWESEVVFKLFLISAVIAIVFFVAKIMRSGDQGCMQEARVVKKEKIENQPYYTLTFEIQASKEEKAYAVKESDANVLSVGDKGMLFYKGYVFLRFVKEK